MGTSERDGTRIAGSIPSSAPLYVVQALARQATASRGGRMSEVLSVLNKYRTIVADPPWQIAAFPKWAGEDGVTPVPYPTMSLDEIKALPVGELADGFAHLYLWTITDYLPQSFDVARAWGFEPSAVLVWCKPPRGVKMGGLFAANVEFVLFCRARSGDAVLRVTTALADAAEAFLDLVESVSPGPYLELFARRNRLGWDTWGNESLSHIKVAA